MNEFNIDDLVERKKLEVVGYRGILANAELELKNLQIAQKNPLELALAEIKYLKQYIEQLEDVEDF